MARRNTTEDTDIEEIGLEDSPPTNGTGKRVRRTITPEQQAQVLSLLRQGSTIRAAEQEAGIPNYLLGVWLQRGGFKYSDARAAQAARALAAQGNVEEPYYSFTQEAEAAFDEGEPLRQTSPRTTRTSSPRRPQEFQPEPASQLLTLIAEGSTLNRAAAAVGLRPTTVLSWLRAGAYPMLAPGGKRVNPEDAQEPFRSFAADFQAAEQAQAA